MKKKQKKKPRTCIRVDGHAIYVEHTIEQIRGWMNTTLPKAMLSLNLSYNQGPVYISPDHIGVLIPMADVK